MNWIVKELLNYNFDKKDKTRMIEYLLLLASGKLEQNYKMPKGQLAGFMDKSVGENLRACANQETGEVQFNAKFLQEPDKYGRDMMTVFHELRHIAQYHGKKNEKADTDRLHLTYANHPDLVTMLCCTELCRDGENIGESWRYDSTTTAIFHSRWNQYLFAKYFYSPCERDARMFGRKFLSSIMDTINPEELNAKEKKNYDSILKSIDEDTKKENKQLADFEQTIRDEDKSFVEVNKKAQQRYMSMVDTATCMSPSSAKNFCQSYGFECFNALFTSLCFVYDDKMANKYYNACLEMQPEENDNKYLSLALNLIKYSDFKPSEKQFKTLCDKCKDFNKNCKDVSLHLDPVKTLKKLKTNQSQESMEQSLGVL